MPPRKISPAELDFLAIYNPSLGTTDDTLENQIVYYSSPKRDSIDNPPIAETSKARSALIHERENEQLRQIGLAQGMVEFGRTFSGGKSVEAVETEKSRIVLHELESGWWILASINLTVLPATDISVGSSSGSTFAQDEYSSRELKPTKILLADLLRAHATFLLHHASSLSALFVRTRRSKFVGILGRYWDTFLWTWNVLLHGNPANNLYGGIKIAACGELGIGVGEEERGSGERAVLEGFIGTIDGLVDVIVSRFGDRDPDNAEVDAAPGGNSRAKHQLPWLGAGNDPAPEDGIIFLGTGALSRKSLRDVSHWMEDLYRWGCQAYGVVDNPSSNRRSKKSKVGGFGVMYDGVKESPVQPHGSIRYKIQQQSSSQQQPTATVISETVGAEHYNVSKPTNQRPSFHRGPPSNTSTEGEPSKTNKLMNYLKLGFGSHWSIGSVSTKEETHGLPRSANLTDAAILQGGATSNVQDKRLGVHDPSLHPQYYASGRFLIGLMGRIEDSNSEDASKVSESRLPDDGRTEGFNARLLLRTLTVELEREVDARAETEISIDLGTADTDRISSKIAGSEHTGTSNTSFESQDRNKTKKLRVVVYVNRPFMFVLLFELRANSLALTSLYRSLHGQIKALTKPLLSSTAFRPPKPDTDMDGAACPIYDLIWDPKLLTVASTIPNIPDATQVEEQRHLSYSWSRIEALSTHIQIINTHVTTTRDPMEIESTCKTSRGWWVVWTRIPDTKTSAKMYVSGDAPKDNAEVQTFLENTPSCDTSTFGSSLVSGQAHPFLNTISPSHDHILKDKEIFLVRKARDHATGQDTGIFVRIPLGREDTSWKSGPSHGIGVDTRRYIDALLCSSR